LIDKRRIDLVRVVLDEIRILMHHNDNKEDVVVYISKSLSEEAINEIKNKIESIIKKEILIEIKIDASIIGGFIAESSSLRIDGSIKRNLLRFKEEMIRN